MTEQEIKVCLMLEKKLDDMIEKYVAGKYMKKCELYHLQEMVKLCHQIKSLK